jgi:hypothetical protein
MENNYIYQRERYFALVSASLSVGEIPFGRDMIIHWLGNYPGDLQAGLLFAQLLIKEGRYGHAYKVLRGILKIDPEYNLAVRMLLDLVEIIDQTAIRKTGESVPENSEIQQLKFLLRSSMFSLGLETYPDETIFPWATQLASVYSAFNEGKIETVEKMILEIIRGGEIPSLARVLHLRILNRSESVPIQSKIEIANNYRKQLPDCLLPILLYAHWLVQTGKGDDAVLLLHEAATRDIGGQVANRLWDGNNPYKRIWPEKLQLPLRNPIPAKVSAILGWNQILPGTYLEENNQIDDYIASLFGEEKGSGQKQKAENIGLGVTISAVGKEELNSTGAQVEGVETIHEQQQESQDFDPQAIEAKNQFQAILEKLAVKRKVPHVTKLDGRFPVYVVFSVRSRMVELYGEKITRKLEKEIERLVSAVKNYPRWNALKFFSDSPDGEIPRVVSNDPWKLKLALKDLDAALAKRGEMIGALLIVGGPEIIPYHQLPNPVDDQDAEVPSDNPYGTSDENYFATEWPVGRLPGGIGMGADLLFEQIKRITDYHSKKSKSASKNRKFVQRISGFISSIINSQKTSYGYTAAIWKKASFDVYKPIGKPQRMFVSPPMGMVGVEFNPISQVSSNGNGKFKGVRLPKSRLGYFNLHGLIDSSEWYGQNDPVNPMEGPDFPIALRPQDIAGSGNKKSKKPPEVIFSEACYGVHITGKSLDEAISLNFLKEGSRAVIGSTCMSYGSVKPPLTAADLLGYFFWRYLCEGLPVGEALKQAKITLALDMNYRQGYLDGEDQKTLISFILFGDPLDRPYNGFKGPKTINRHINPDELETVCDKSLDLVNSQEVPVEIMENVRQVVEKYLPGMSNADISFCHERDDCGVINHSSPTSQFKKFNKSSIYSRRSVITLSKTFRKNEINHPNYARLTLGADGKLEKLVVSR